MKGSTRPKDITHFPYQSRHDLLLMLVQQYMSVERNLLGRHLAILERVQQYRQIIGATQDKISELEEQK